MKTACALVLSLGVLAASALPAAADPIVYGNDILSDKPGELNGGPLDVLVDGRGVATLVYGQSTGPSSSGVFARRRAPGGAYGPPIPVGGDEAGFAEAGIAQDGTVTVVWDEDGTDAGIYARTIRPDGSLGAVQTLGTAGNPVEPRIAVAPDGAALVAWRRTGPPNRIIATSRKAGETSFSTSPDNVSSTAPGEDALRLDSLVGTDGAAYVAYVQEQSGDRKVFIRRFGIAVNSALGAAQQVSVAAPGFDANDATAAIDPITRRVVLAWSESAPAAPSTQDVIKSRSVRADLAQFAAVQKISSAAVVAGRDADEPYVDASPTGAIAVGWREDTAAHSEGAAPVAVRPPGGAFGPAFDVVADDSQFSAGPAIPRWDSRGRLFAAFRQHRPDDDNSRAAVRMRRADGTWAATTVASPNRTEPAAFASGALAVPDRDGNLLITYAQRLPPDNAFTVVAAYGDDDGAPEVDPIAPSPAAALVSAPLQLSTVVRDFSTTTTTWSFGDGSANGQGLSVAHAYAQPGSYDVSVAATDATGQTASRTTRATISARPVVGPPRANRRPDSNITLRRKRMRRRAFKRVRGTASDDTRVARVQVAVVRVRGTKRRPKCAVMRRNASFKRVKAVKRTCRPRFWQTAKGTTSWSLKLKKRLGRGRYVVFSRAIDDQGARERSFSKRDGNRRALRLRR